MASPRVIDGVVMVVGNAGGPTGTGKSVVMLHRAAWLAETRPGRVVVTSFVRTLPHHQNAVYERFSPHTVDRVDFLGVHEVARRLPAESGQRMNVHQRRIDAAFGAAWTRVGAAAPLAGIADARYWRQEIERRGVHDHNEVLSAAVDLVSRDRPEPG